MTHPLFQIIRQLEQYRLWFRLDHHRADAVMVTVTPVGERLEIEVFEDGHVEFSRFTGDESVESDAALLDDLIRQHGHDSDEA